LLYGVAPSVRGAPQYNIVALDVLPGGVDSYATSINELGVVVGHSTLNRSGHVGQSRPVMWNSMGQATELWSDQVFGGIPLGVNNLGQVVGRYGSGSGIPLPGPGIPPGGAFIWDPATRNFTDLGDLGGQNAQATGINDWGQVSGSSENFQGEPRAFIWDAVAGMREIGTLGGVWSFGNGINSSGQIAGYSWRADFSEHGYIWTPLVGFHDIGSPGGGGTRGMAINDAGVLVGIDWGTATTSGGLIIANTTETNLIEVASGTSLMPFDIDNRGQVVGYMASPSDLNPEAFIWSADTGFVNLESLLLSANGWDLEQATGINDRGQIIGFGILNDQVRGFLLTPVPERSSFVLILGCIAHLFVFSRPCRRR
jgi:probable HAF family extracellular repeat protein